MLTNKLAYDFCKLFLNVSEVKGKLDNELIELAHKTTKIEAVTSNGDDTDAIPWCASWVNLMVLMAGYTINPSTLRGYLLKTFKNDNDLKVLTQKLGYVFTKIIEPSLADDGKALSNPFSYSNTLTLPLGSPLASKWQDWGVGVPITEAEEGDLVILLRVGGYHVCFLADSKINLGAENFKALGGNQGDKVSYASLKTANIIAVRRCTNARDIKLN